MVFQKQIRQYIGFTTIELVVVMAIAGILIAIVVPSFQAAIKIASTTREINAFVGDLGFARAEAIKEGVSVTMCASSNGTSCSGSNNWQNGWIIFSNPGLTGTNIVPLRKQLAFTSTDTLIGDNSTSAINFSLEGFTINLPGNPVTFAVQTVPLVASYTQCTAVNNAGRHVNQKSGTGNCP
ncbi:GspH/FimT family pseudopilin [Undibacterium sp. SXout20W]|uniref:GspH/FimT family pseudopilin n=1 Tax=Undibacterium sp. SXout20W TaxID=3413051 RepID=UPI003BF02AF2